MVLKLYVDHMSQPSRAIMMLVRANKIPVEEVIISIQEGAQKTEEYAKVNKFQKVPAIVHDGFHLAESVAILRYLTREFPVASHWYPEDSKETARIDEFIAWHHLGLRLPLTRYILILLLPSKLSAIPPTPELIAEHKKALDDAFDNFVKFWLEGPNEFIYGNEMSIADLVAIGEIEMMRLLGHNPRVGRPKLDAYMNRAKTTLGPKLYDEVHDNLYKAEEFMKQMRETKNQGN